MPGAKRNRVDGEGPAHGPSIVPTVRYRDVPAAIDWLCEAFGFEEHRVVTGHDGGLRYAELTFGGGMVMVAPVEESAVGKLMAQPGDVGGIETQICYLYVADARAHYARAKAAGAEILLDIQDQSDSGRGYSCRDPEGHIWNFGTYDPWERQGGWLGARGEHSGRRGARLFVALALIAGVTTAALHQPTRQGAGELALAAISRVADAVHAAGADRSATEPDTPALDEIRIALAKTQAALALAEQLAQETRQQLAQERRAREAAELAAKELSKQATLQPAAGSATATGKVGAEIEAARIAKEAAERAAKETRELLGQARGAKEAAERAAREARDQVRKERRRRAAARAAAAADAAAMQPSPYGSP